MHVFDELIWRGLVQDYSDADGIRSLRPGTAFYVGFDPSAPSLHFGNLLQLIVAVHLANKARLQPIILFGGATGAIGDPKATAERILLSREVIDSNIASQMEKVVEILARQNCRTDFVNNYDWTSQINVLEFLRDIGKHFTVNYMLAKEVVKTRLGGEGISFTEFSYMLLQANDFAHLVSHKNCQLQYGGSDQWGNITAGLELIRRKGLGEAFAFSVPLLLDEQGRKYGKSETGALWLNPEMTSPYKFHQYWLNVADGQVLRLLKIFTFLTQEEINQFEKLIESQPERREAQKALADNVCTFVHGEEATQEAKKSASVLFGGSLQGLADKQLEEIFSDVPSSSLPRSKAVGMAILDLFTNANLVKSKGEARRLISAGGAYLNNERITDQDLQLTDSLIDKSSLLILRSGKKSYHLIKLI